MLVVDQVLEYDELVLNIESVFHLGPRVPKKTSSSPKIFAPSNLLHYHEFTSPDSR